MATKVQKKVLWWMLDNGGELFICTGNKRVLFAHTDVLGKPNELFCKGNDNLVGGLLANKFAERVGPCPTAPLNSDQWKLELHLFHRFRITDTGRKAAGKERPDPREHCNVPHRNKVYRRTT